MKHWKEIVLVSIAFIILATSTVVHMTVGWGYRPHRSYITSITAQEHQLQYYAAKEALVEEVDNYIHEVAPNSALTGLAIVNGCEKYNIDVIFVLAQGQQESHFGTMGIAAKTNSVFNVLAYDGRSAADMNKKGHGYSHPDLSVEPYLELLINNYLVDGKTEKDLLHNYVNVNGDRYASCTNYEDLLSGLYIKIDSTTDITEKYKRFRKCKIIAEI